MNKNTHTSIFVEYIKRIPGLELESAVETIGGSYEIYEKMLEQVLRLLPSSLKLMGEYVGTGDLSSFGVKVHGIKGSLRQAGYIRLAKTAETLEREAKAGNQLYCREQYDSFKNELLWFCEQINTAFQNAKDDAGAVSGNEAFSDIVGYIDTLTRVRTAIEECDSLLAAELLSPLTRKRFAGGAGNLIKRTMEELECYRPEKALGYISDLFSECIEHDAHSAE